MTPTSAWLRHLRPSPEAVHRACTNARRTRAGYPLRQPLTRLALLLPLLDPHHGPNPWPLGTTLRLRNRTGARPNSTQPKAAAAGCSRKSQRVGNRDRHPALVNRPSARSAARSTPTITQALPPQHNKSARPFRRLSIKICGTIVSRASPQPEAPSNGPRPSHPAILITIQGIA